MDTLSKSIVRAGLALTVAMGVGGPAVAVSVQNFNTYDTKTQTTGIVIAIKNEIYRNLLNGQTAQAACINDNFIPRESGRNGFDDILDNSTVVANPATQSMESFIMGAINTKCRASTSQNVTTAPVIQKFTPINEFFSVVPDRLNEARVLNMALGVQALRAHTQSNDTYSQCIMTKLVTPKDANTPADGFTDLFNQLESHKTVSIPLEQILAAAVIKNCGAEPPEAAKPIP